MSSRESNRSVAGLQLSWSVFVGGKKKETALNFSQVSFHITAEQLYGALTYISFSRRESERKKERKKESSS